MYSYPKIDQTPPGGHYLKFSPRRCELSLTSGSVNEPKKSLKATLAQCKATDTLTKAAASSLYNSIARDVTQFLLMNAPCEATARRLGNKLSVLLNEAQSELELENKSISVIESAFKIILLWKTQIIEENPDLTVLKPFSLTENDFNTARYDFASYQEANGESRCHAFAFYKLNEVHAFPYLFCPQSNPWPAEIVTQPIELLQLWGYNLVLTPTPGDLVVYCSTISGAMKVTHFAIWTSSQKVISKFGIEHVSEHPLDDVVLGYGNFVYFFHKKIKAVWAATLLKEVQKAIQDKEHPFTYTPLSTKGCVLGIKDYLKSLPVEQVFEDSLYNRNYTEAVRSKIHDSLETIPSAFTKTEALLEIQNLIYRASEEVKADI